jgi:hypothetical protein
MSKQVGNEPHTVEAWNTDPVEGCTRVRTRRHRRRGSDGHLGPGTRPRSDDTGGARGLAGGVGVCLA